MRFGLTFLVLFDTTKFEVHFLGLIEFPFCKPLTSIYFASS